MKKGRSKYHGRFRTGDTFGEWTVTTGRISGSPARIDVKCSCGTEKSVDVYTLIKGKSVSCGHIARSGTAAPNWRGINGIPATVLSKNARALGMDSSSYSLLANAFVSQNNTCPVTSNSINYTNAKVIRSGESVSGQGSATGQGSLYWVDASVSNFVNSVGGISNAISTATSIVSANHSNIFEEMGMTPTKDTK